MRYDIRINDFYYKTIEGDGIDNALENAGMDYDFRMTGTDCGTLEMEGLPGDADPEIREAVATSGGMVVTFGPEE